MLSDIGACVTSSNIIVCGSMCLCVRVCVHVCKCVCLEPLAIDGMVTDARMNKLDFDKLQYKPTSQSCVCVSIWKLLQSMG